MIKTAILMRDSAYALALTLAHGHETLTEEDFMIVMRGVWQKATLAVLSAEGAALLAEDALRARSETLPMIDGGGPMDRREG